jgi:choline monooxygenase
MPVPEHLPDIHEDIRQAETLPARFYSDPSLYQTVREQIFSRSWQFITDVSAVSVPGQIYPFTLLEGFLDEPLLFTRDTDDRLHCLSNVCTHRGNLVAESAGHERALRCRYHGRRFGLDGCFQHMPEFEGVAGFPSEADNLSAVPHGSWGPLLFASVNPSCSLEELLAPIVERVGFLPLEEFVFSPERSRDYLVNANWALYCDNYLEGFHIPFVHNALAAALDYGSYRTELFRFVNLQVGVSGGGEEVFHLPTSSPDYGQEIAAYYFWVFPNMMFNYYPWGLSINVVRPLGPQKTKVSFLSYVWDSSKLEMGAGAALDRVEREDEAIVEAVQKGVKSRFYNRGRYSPAREQGVHHFHRLIMESLKT